MGILPKRTGFFASSIFLALLISACEQRATLGELDLDRGPSVLGTDSNGNGVRDDVRNWIHQQTSVPSALAALMQDARATQDYLTVAEGDVDAAKRAHRLVSKFSKHILSELV